MRHLLSLIAGVVAALLSWLLLATGQLTWQTTLQDWDQAGTYNTAELVGPAVILLVAGVLLGLLGTLRWSPAGPVAAGVLLALPAVLLLFIPFRTRDWFADEWRLLGQDLAPRLPLENGTMLVLGVLLLMATFSVQRWRQWPVTPAATPDTGSPAGPAAEPSAESEAEPTAGPDNGPAESTPSESTPSESTPSESTPSESTPSEDTPESPPAGSEADPAEATQEPKKAPKKPRPDTTGSDGA